MTTINLSKEFFLGGNSIFTVDNGKGEHYTFKINKPKRENPRYAGKPAPYFVSLLTGPDNVNSYNYLGMIDSETGEVKLTSKSRFNDQTVSVKVIRWTMKRVYTDKILPDGYQVRHAGKCGCCGRVLTETLSVKIGIGPECRSRLGL